MAPGGTAGCWAILAACWGLVALNGLVWAAARIAAGLSGGAAEPFGIKFAADVLHGRTATAWPHTPTPPSPRPPSWPGSPPPLPCWAAGRSLGTGRGCSVPASGTG